MILVREGAEPERPLAEFVDRFALTGEFWGTRDRQADETVVDYVGPKRDDRSLRVASWGPEEIAPSMLSHAEKLAAQAIGPIRRIVN